MKLTNNMNELEQSKTLEDLQEDLLALKMRIAFQADFEDELDALQNQEPDDALNQAMDEAAPRIYRLFEKEVRRARSRRIVRQYMPKVCRACAVVLLVFYLGLTVAVATMEPVREGVVDFIQDITDKYTRFDIELDEVEIPPEWEGEYYPTYIPEGYPFHSARRNVAWYGKGKTLKFTEFSDAIDFNLDTENTFIEVNYIRGFQTYRFENKDWITVIIQIDSRFFRIDGMCEENEIISIAESVSKIE